MSSKVTEGQLVSKGLRFAIVVARFNSFITERLLAGALDALGRPEEAIAVCREVIRRRPNLASAYYDLGSIELHYGRLDDAAQNFRRALALEPRHGEWHRMLSGIVRHKTRDADIDAMQGLYGHAAVPENDRLHLAFGLGKALGDIGEHAEAFPYFLEGNRLKRARYSYASAESDRLFADMRELPALLA